MSIWRVGTSVLALAAVGAVTATLSGSPEGNPNFSLSFTAVTQPTPVWPETRWVRANVTGPGVPTAGTYNDQQTHQWAFYWSDLEDSSAWQYYTGPLTWLADARTMPGRWCAHCPSSTGSKTWRCTAINMSNWSEWTTATYTFTVADPATEFTAAQTYVVSPTSNWGIFPSHNTGNRYTSWDAFRTALNSLSGRVRVIMERGQSYSVGGGSSFPAGVTHFWMGSVGAGARPEMTLTSGFFMFSDVRAAQYWFSDFVVNGVSSTVTPVVRADDGFLLSGISGNAYVTMRNVKLRNLSLPMQFGNPLLKQYSLVDCEIDGFVSSATLNTGVAGDVAGAGSYLCYRGHQCIQNVDASWHPAIPAEVPNWSGGFGHRDEQFDVMVYDAFRGFTRSGWFDNIAGSDRSSLQSFIRPGLAIGGYCGMSRIVAEGGWGIGITNGRKGPADIVLDSNYTIMSGGQNRNAFEANLSGVSLRNSTVVIPPGIKITGEAAVFQTPNTAGTHFPDLATTQATPNFYLNNTIALLEDSLVNGNSVPSVVNAPGNGMTVTVANTAWYRPFVSPLDEGPFNLARTADPLQKGYFDSQYANWGWALITSRSGSWADDVTVNGAQIEAADGNNVIFKSIPNPTIPLGAVTNSAGGTGTVILESHSHRAMTALPWWRLDFDGMTQRFHIGSTLTNGTATAEIRYVQYSGTTGTLWLGPVQGGTFTDNQPITDNRVGAAVANGNQSLNVGIYASFRPLAGATVLAGATGSLIPPRDQSNQTRPALASRGAMELLI